MTLSATTPVITYTGNGVTTLFSVPFQFFAGSDLRVTLNGVAQVLGTNYTVTGGSGATGSVSMTAAPASGVVVRIERFTDAIQGTDYGAAGVFPSQAHELGMDRVMMVAQEARTTAVETLSNDISGRVVVATGSNTARSLASRFGEVENVKDFGAVGNGVADDTAAIQAALNAGGTVTLPPGVFKITSALNVAVPGTRIVGAGVNATQIYQHTLSARLFNITAANCIIENVTLDYNGTPTSGATAIFTVGAETYLRSFKINRAWEGVRFAAGSINSKANMFEVYNCASSGVYFIGVGGCNISGFRVDAVTTSNAASGCIRMADFVEGVTVADGETLNGVYSLLTSASSYGAGTRPAYNRFSSVYFDGAAQGVYVDQAVEFTFTGCWFSGGRTGGGFDGVALGTTDSVAFIGCTFANCGRHGARVLAASNRASFTGCKALGNSVTAGAGVANGIHIDANTNNFSIVGCTATNALFVGSQSYGIRVETGTSNIYTITGNVVTGNATGGILDGGTGVTKTIAANPGYLTMYRGQATINTGASTVSFDHFLAATPGVKDIILTNAADPNGAGIARYWVSGTSATQVTVTANTIATSPLVFNFDARIAGA